MEYTTTISQKGQIVVPKAIRDKLNIHSSDVIHIRLEGSTIIAEPVMSIDEAIGMFLSKKPITKKERKEAIRSYIEGKFERKFSKQK